MATRLTFNQWLVDDGMPAARTLRPRHDEAQPLEHLEPCECGLVSTDPHVHVYNEEAFRYFLDIERKRSEISNRPFLLLLLDLKKPTSDIDAATAERLFAALAMCVRETDFIGWYRAGSVVGAVLTQHADGVGTDVQETVRRRVVDVVAKRVSKHLAEQVQVRLYQASPSTVA